MNLPRDFKDLLEEFVREGVECVVLGGYAFAYHAEPRATKDLDVLIGGSQDNLERAARALARFGAHAAVVEATQKLAENEVVYLGRPPLWIDLLRTLDGVVAQDVLRAAGRPQDLADVAKLERVRDRQRRP